EVEPVGLFVQPLLAVGIAAQLADARRGHHERRFQVDAAADAGGGVAAAGRALVHSRASSGQNQSASYQVSWVPPRRGGATRYMVPLWLTWPSRRSRMVTQVYG